MSAPIPRLRGHHLVCLNFYHGQGYDPDFIRNLDSVMERAKASGVSVTSGPDDVCSACPHLKNGVCASDETSQAEVTAMDEDALLLFGVGAGDSVNWAEIMNGLMDVFPLWLPKYCASCGWRAACEEDAFFRRMKSYTEVREAFCLLEPYIERHNSAVCPTCPAVCCIDRHGTYDADDALFFHIFPPGFSHHTPAKADDTEPCRFLGERGCTIPRHMRPFRCTWYFCERLLRSMESEGGRRYRTFVESFRRLQDIRRSVFQPIF